MIVPPQSTATAGWLDCIGVVSSLELTVLPNEEPAPRLSLFGQSVENESIEVVAA